MALGFGNSAGGSTATPGSTATASIVNNANGVSVLYLAYYSNGAYASTTSITDASGGTWFLRKRVRFQSAWAGAGSTATATYFVQETWWKNDVTSTNRSLTFNIANNSACIRFQWMYQCYTGSLSVAAPWDTHASLLTAAQTFGNPITTLAAITLSVTTAQNNSQVIAFLSEETSTNNSTLSSTGTGMTAENNQTDGVSPNQFHLFLQNQLKATAGAVTAPATQTKQSFVYTVDALTGTSTGSSASAGDLEIASLQLLSSGNANSGTGTSVTFTYTNTAPCEIIAEIVTLGGTGGFVPISGVTDSAGNTWNRRSSKQFLSSNFSGLSGGINHLVHEVWWANVTAVHGSAVTVTITKTGTANEGSNTTITWATFTGSMSAAAPWDTDANLGKINSYSNASTATFPSGTWNLSSSPNGGAIVIGSLHQMGATGNVNVSAAPSGYSFNSSHITIGNSTTGPAQNALAATTAAQSGSGTQTWQTNGTLEWTLFVDALSGSTNGSAAEVVIPPSFQQPVVNMSW